MISMFFDTLDAAYSKIHEQSKFRVRQKVMSLKVEIFTDVIRNNIKTQLREDIDE